MMAEIETPPLVVMINDEPYEAFGDDHSLADICRWLMKNPDEAAEVHTMLGDMLFALHEYKH
jgi:hypothetical protein